MIYVDQSATTVLMALRDLVPPSDAPDLPDQITDVWVFSENYGVGEYVAWRAGQNRAWQRVVLTAQPGSQKLVALCDPPPPAAVKAGLAAPGA